MALQKRILVVALALVTIMMMASVWAFLTSMKTIPSKGSIYAFKVAVYENDTTTGVITPFLFDNLNPDSSTYRDIYVKNEAGDKNVTLSWTVGNWTAVPENSSDIGVTLTWNYDGNPIAHGTGTMVRLTLYAPNNAATQAGLSFDVRINITGTSTT